MKKLLAMIAIVVALDTNAHAADEQSCVPTGELKPVETPLNEGALVQAKHCALLREKNPAPANWKDCPTTQALIQKALDFCTAPLDFEKAAPTGDEIDQASAIVVGSLTCDKRVTTVTRKTAFSSTFPTPDALLQGLANFIISRAKAEAMAFLVDHIADRICGNADGTGLLPTTCAVLAGKPGGSAWGTLKIAFEEDMQRLPERALACAAKKAGATDGAQTLIYYGVQAARLAAREDGTSDPRKLSIFAGFRRDNYTDAECTKDRVGCSLHVFGFTAQLLSLQEDGTPGNIAYFYELVARRWIDEVDRVKLAPQLVAVLKKTKDRITALIAHFQKVNEAGKNATTNIATAIGEIKTAKGNKDANAALRGATKLLHETVGFIDVARGETFEWLHGEYARDDETLAELDKLDATAKAGLKTVRSALDAYDKITNQKYAYAYVAIVLAIEALKLTKIGADLDADVQKLLPFICEIASAKSADEVTRSLEAAAAPVGGGLAKRGSKRRTVALTAFAGATLGREIAYATDGATDAVTEYGLFVPVGVDVSWGLGDNHSLGFFLSVIDLGALATFRDKQSAVSTDSMMNEVERSAQVGIQQVVSPGVFAVWGIDRFVLGAGISMTPELRGVTKDGMLVDRANALRFGVFAAIDVTIFPF